MVRTHVFSLITISMILGSQACAMTQENQEPIELTECTKKPKYQKFQLKFPESGDMYTSNRTESVLITAVQAGELESVQAFFNDQDQYKNLRIDGCILALFVATQNKELMNIESFLTSQPIVQNILMQGTPLALNKLFNLCAYHEQYTIVSDILDDVEKFEKIEPENIASALFRIILDCEDDLVEKFLANQSARTRLSIEALHEMLAPAKGEPYYEKIQQLIAEKS